MSKYSKKLMFSLLAVAVGATIVAACASVDGTFQATRGSVIQNVTVVSTRDGSLLSGQAIVIEDGKIVRIAPTASIKVSGSAQAIDASGKYIVPGFLDMHAHVMTHVDEKPGYFPVMLANGITGFREMGVFPGQFPNMVERAHKLNLDIIAGRIEAPEVLVVPSDIFAGTTSAVSATQGVDRQKALGVDFIKVIAASRDAMLAFLSEAKAQGLPLAGHLTPAVSATESSQLGWKAIEHLGSNMGILLDCSTDEVTIRKTLIAAAGNKAPAFPTDAATLQRVVDTYSDDKCRALAQVFVKNGTWQVPTLRRVRALETTDDPFFANDPDLMYVDKTRLAMWAQQEQAYARLSAPTRSALRAIFARQQSVTKMLKQSGVKMLAGSDSGVASVWVMPGFGLHDEFHELAAAGLSPLEILQMTTLNAAEFLNRLPTMGSVDVGKNADLVLLDANPIADVLNLDKISGMFLKGRYLSQASLQKLASDTAATYKAAPAPTKVLAVGTGHVD